MDEKREEGCQFWRLEGDLPALGAWMGLGVGGLEEAVEFRKKMDQR